jgi:fluoride ion exporter CrcB/FEX
VLRKIFVDSFTENDGKSFDLARILAAFAALTGIPFFLALTAYSVLNDPSHHFEMQGFAGAFTTIMGGIAVNIGAIAMKQRTDLPVPPDPSQGAQQ